MARRRSKKRTHVGAKNPQNGAPANNMRQDPRSMVIRIGAGEVGPSVSQLVKDVRQVMEPNTASRLKERKANRLRDYLAMAGPLGVSHLLLFSKGPTGHTNLRLALAPRGPTLHFRVDQYSLCKDVRKALKRAKGGPKDYLTPPLLVMNNFVSNDSSSEANKVPKHLENLTVSVFQSMFPPISPQTTPLKSIRRVLLLNRENDPKDEGSYIINFRHFAITTKAVGMSRGVRRLNRAEKLLHSSNTARARKAGLPNLGKLEDIADFIGAGEDGFTTDASDSEIDTDAEVEVADITTKKVLSAKARQLQQRDDEDDEEENGEKKAHVEKRGIKLVELGPRMKLRMLKVEEGVCSGKVMWHEYMHKSKEEIKKLDAEWAKKRKEKEERKRIQRENVEKKRKARAQNGQEDDDEDEDLMDVEEWDSEGLEGDAEMGVNEDAEERGEWEDEEEEIADEA